MGEIVRILLRWKIEIHAYLEAVWDSRWFGIVATAAFAAAIVYVMWFPPAPGVSVAVMGVAAAIMAARGKATGAEKATWMFIISALLVTEVLAIRNDRREQRIADSKRSGYERQKFQEIGQGIQQSITNGQQQFQAAMQQSSQQFDASMTKAGSMISLETSAVSKMDESLKTMTGGDSFPVVVAQGETTPLVLGIKTCNKCKYGIPKAYVDIEHVPASGPPERSYNLFEGPVEAGFVNWLPTAVSPPTSGESKYTVYFLATNGITVEDLGIRWNNTTKLWEFSYTIHRIVHTGRLNKVTGTYELDEKRLEEIPWNSWTSVSNLTPKVKELH